MVERRSALADVLKPGLYGAAASGGPGIEIQELRPLAVAQVAAFDETGASAGIGAALGAPAPLHRNGVAEAGETRVLWTGPGRWLVVEPESRDLAALLARHCPGEVAAVTDLGHARTALRVEGPQVRVLLAKLCTLDFDPAAFPPGSCAQSQFGQVGVRLYCRHQDRFDVFVFRGFAVAAWEAVLDAALEFGCCVI